MTASAALLSVAAGALLGLSLAAPPGPMNAIIAEATVSRGFRAGVAAGLGAMAADACFFVLALVGVTAAVNRVPPLRDGLLAAGGLLMLYFAYGAARRARRDAADAEPEGAERASFGAAFAVALTNPYQITWWLTAGVALLDPGAVEVFGRPLPTAGALAVLGFFGGILAWITAFPAVLGLAGRRTGAGRWVGYASAGLLAWFGAAFLVAAV